MRRLLGSADVVVHLAAVVGAAACDRDPTLATGVNRESVRLLCRLRSPNQLVIFPNTNSGYGVTSGESYCTEDSPLRPISLYGRTKVEAEQLLLEQPNTIALRLATVFGMSPRMRLDLLVNHFVYAAFKEGYLVIFEKDFKRNFIHIRDVADCVLHCMGHAAQMQGRVYNVGLDSANLSKEELALKVKEHVPRLLHPLRPHRPGPGQAQLRRLQSAVARGGISSHGGRSTTASASCSRATPWKAGRYSRTPREGHAMIGFSPRPARSFRRHGRDPGRRSGHAAALRRRRPAEGAGPCRGTALRGVFPRFPRRGLSAEGGAADRISRRSSPTDVRGSLRRDGTGLLRRGVAFGDRRGASSRPGSTRFGYNLYSLMEILTAE